MRAVVFEEFGGPLVVADVPRPEAPVQGVVVEVKATGVCRSDWHGWVGHDAAIALPHVPGHEMAGVVAAIGDGVEEWHVGDRVTVPFSCGCGTCPMCAEGFTNLCHQEYQPGFTGWGAFAEYVVVPWADVNLVAIPESMSFVAAASLGCRFMTAYHGLTARAALLEGEWLAVHGAGGVGLSVVQIGVALGAQVVAVDIDTAKLDRARQLGAAFVVDATATDSVKEIRRLSGGGAHVSIDALGAEETAANSIRCLRRRGRHVQIGLVIGEGRSLPIPMTRVIALELDIYGSHGMPAASYPDLLNLIAAGAVEPELLVGRTIDLDEAPAALEAMGRFAATGVTVIEV